MEMDQFQKEKKPEPEGTITAEQARKIAASATPRVANGLYKRVCRAIRSAAQEGKTHTDVAVNYGYDQQDALAKKLKGDGFSIGWVTTYGPRTDDSAVITISWKG